MTERHRPEQNELREESAPKVKQDPRRDRSVPLWASALQDVLKELAALKERVKELEDAAAIDRAVLLRMQGHAQPTDSGATATGALDDQSRRPTLQVRAAAVPPTAGVPPKK